MSNAMTTEIFELVNLDTGVTIASTRDLAHARYTAQMSYLPPLGVRIPGEAWDVCALEAAAHAAGIPRKEDGVSVDYDASVSLDLFAPKQRAWMTKHGVEVKTWIGRPCFSFTGQRAGNGAPATFEVFEEGPGRGWIVSFCTATTGHRVGFSGRTVCDSFRYLAKSWGVGKVEAKIAA